VVTVAVSGLRRWIPMGWFTRQESALKLGDDPVQLLRAWVNRDHWKKMAPSILSQIIANSQNGIFDRPLEGMEVTRLLICVAEEHRLVQTNFLQIVNAEGENIEAVLRGFAMTLCRFGRECIKCSLNAANEEEHTHFNMRADMAFNGAIVCDPFEFAAYMDMLNLCWNVYGNRAEALEWCKRFRRAEAMLLRIPESEVGPVRQAQKESLCPVKLAEARKMIEKYAPHLLPTAAAADDRSVKEFVEGIEKELLGKP
jgi:hypothetical protein